MELPYLQSYNDPKKQKAYLRYMKGQSQRTLALALKIPPRTVAHWGKTDGWEDERKARKIAATEAPNVAAVAAGKQKSSAAAASSAATKAPEKPPQPETRGVGMERILARQQRVTGLLVDAYERDVEKTLADAQGPGKSLTRSQIAQLTMLGNNLMTMERKAWCVPDKIETKDTTPTPADRARKFTDEQLQTKLATARETRLAAERRGGVAADRGGSAAESIH